MIQIVLREVPLLKQLISFLKSERVRAWLLIVFGSAIGAAAYPMFLTPNSIAPGGLTGVAMILNHIFHWPIGVTSLLLCVPLFLAGWKQSGLLFVLRSVGATVLFSLMIEQYIIAYFWLIFAAYSYTAEGKASVIAVSAAGGTLLTSLAFAPLSYSAETDGKGLRPFLNAMVKAATGVFCWVYLSSGFLVSRPMPTH